MRILVSAYYCSPYQGGEAAVGWKYAKGLAALGHDVTVVFGDLSAEEPMRADMERLAATTGLPANLHAIHVAPDRVTRWIHDLHARPGCWFLYYHAYRRWQKLALEKAREAHSAKPFDLAHHVTVIGYREPGYLWTLEIPFFWGPINGAALMPWGYIRTFGWGGRYRHLLRNAMNWLQMRLPSRSRQAAQRAAKVWTVTKEDQQMVEQLWGVKADPMIETGAEPCPDPLVRVRVDHEPLRLVWCGILEARKALDLVLSAMAYLPDETPCELQIIGEGPERQRWQRMAAELDIDQQVFWHGRVSHEEAQARMAHGHALIHSSVKEGTPHVVLEAMAQGLPVICHDACGMGVAVTPECGIKVPMLDPETSIRGFRDAILRLTQEPNLLSRLSQGAISRAGELTWEKKVRTVAQAYEEALIVPREQTQAEHAEPSADCGQEASAPGR